jgi:tetratricopeptide (TPR) repeat protein
MTTTAREEVRDLRHAARIAAVRDGSWRGAWFLAVGLMLMMAAPSGTRGEEPDGPDWVGKRVVPKRRDFTLRVGEDGRECKVRPAVYRVEQVKGNSLRLKSERGPGGCVAADPIVSVETAVGFFSDAIGANPLDPSSYAMRAWRLLEERNDPEHAVNDCDEAIRLDPKDPFTDSIRGAARSARGDHDKAIADYSEVIRIDPKHAEAYSERGEARMSHQEYDKALADCVRAIRLDPKSTDAQNGRAWFRATCPVANYRDGVQAIASATKACELTDGKEPGVLDTLAAADAEAGDFVAAVKWQTQAIELETDSPEKADYGSRLNLYQDRKPYREAKP